MKTESLRKLRACEEAVEWAGKQKNKTQAWNDCERGDWMLWLIGKLSGGPESAKRKKLVLCTCKCARLALKHVPKSEDRPRKAIETAEKWARGDRSVTIDDVHAAAYAANAAAAYAAANAAYAADAAAYAANAAAANAAANAAYAAAANAAYAAAANAANAAYAAAANAAAKTKTLKKCADIVREFYPNPPRF